MFFKSLHNSKLFKEFYKEIRPTINSVRHYCVLFSKSFFINKETNEIEEWVNKPI